MAQRLMGDQEDAWWNSQWDSEPIRANGNAKRLLWFLRHECSSEWTNVFSIPAHICRWQTAIMIAAKDPSRYDTWVEDSVPFLMCRPSAKQQHQQNRSQKRFGPQRKRCQATGPHPDAEFWPGKSGKTPGGYPQVGQGKATADEMGWEDTEMSKDCEMNSESSL